MKAVFGILLGVLLGAGTTLQLAEREVKIVSVSLPLPEPEPKGLLSERELECVARTVYGEARGEPEAGQIWVALSVVARVLDDRWPSDACSVVRQKNQFAGYWAVAKHSQETMNASILASEIYWALPEEYKGIVYFTSAKEPSKFHRRQRKVFSVGNHTFYSDRT